MTKGQAMLVVRWVLVIVGLGVVRAGTATVSAQDRPDARAILGRYCVTCHSDRMLELGRVPISLETVDVRNPSATAGVWESVIRKLRTETMPPAGLPQPDAATSRALVSWLETELDRAHVATPDPGRLRALRRLTRTEYGNAVRDLLAVTDLPQEMDLELLLPADNATSGFDNLAELLFVDPTLLERYLETARQISRLAVSDPTVPMFVERYRFPTTLPQDRHIEGMPPGTRGGTMIRIYLPVDGEYVITVEFDGRAREQHQLEVTVDGERVGLLERALFEHPEGLRYEVDDPPFELSLPLRAGPRSIGVAYVKKTSAISESPVRTLRRGPGPLPSLSVVSVKGPYTVAGRGDTPSRRRIFVCRPGDTSEEARCSNTILSTLARRAYRRPVTDEDLKELRPFYEAGRAEGSFDTGIQWVIERLLMSPSFLFRIERDPPHAGPIHRISDVELASRLSFFLWSSIPDDELLDAAIAGRLKDPGVLERQVRRMLSDSRSSALVSNFAAQWLFLRDLGTKTPDRDVFPGFDETLRQAFQRETELFLESIVSADRSVLDVLAANYTFVNERLARHYGIPNVYGSHFRRITLGDDSPRRGLLGQGSILTLTSMASRTSPVLRGKWILDNILASPPPPPPPNIPPLEAKNQDDKPVSMRAAMARHRTNPVCASCHARMDPLGFAMENFDAIGKWRTEDADGMPLDVSGVLPDGTTFDGVKGLREILSSHEREFVYGLTEKLLTYAVGRNVVYHDAPAIRAIIREAAPSRYRFSALVLGIVTSTPFQLRRSEL